MPSTRATSRAAIKDMDSRIEKIGNQLQRGLDALKDSIVGPNKDAADGSADARKALSDFEMVVKVTLDGLRSEVAAINASVFKYNEEISRQLYANHIVLQGFRENDDENICPLVCSFLNSKLRTDLTENDINSCYRLGRKSAVNEGRARPVAIQFVHRWKRDRVFGDKKKLKGSGVVLYEMLTTYKVELLKKAKQVLGVKKCWTWRGNIYVNINGAKTRIDSEGDFPSSDN